MKNINYIRSKLLINRIREGLILADNNDIRRLWLDEEGEILFDRDNIYFGASSPYKNSYSHSFSHKGKLFVDGRYQDTDVNLSHEEYKYICDLFYEKINEALDKKMKMLEEEKAEKANIIRSSIYKSKNKNNRIFGLMQKVTDSLKGNEQSN